MALSIKLTLDKLIKVTYRPTGDILTIRIGYNKKKEIQLLFDGENSKELFEIYRELIPNNYHELMKLGEN